MFSRLFSESGLSLDRLRALVEVGAYGNIVKAVDGDPARQSLYSRQLKELEAFFQASLVERHGKGVRLTVRGLELARISRFFLMGLSNFQRGCLAEGQSYRIGADETFSACFLLPLLGDAAEEPGICYRVETVLDSEVERRLHDLTLDFGIVRERVLSRPLQMKTLGQWHLKLWIPRRLCKSAAQARAALRERRLPWVRAAHELPLAQTGFAKGCEPAVACDSFVQTRSLMASERFAGVLPDFLAPTGRNFFTLASPEIEAADCSYALAWNPRLLRLNPHAGRRRDLLIRALSLQLRAGAVEL